MMMSRRLIAIFCLGWLGSPQAWAYIPRSETIIRKMTVNNGRNDYKVVREIILEADSKEVRAKETWWVANGDLMKLVVESAEANQPWRFSILYKQNNRQTISSNKNVKTYPKSPEFFEPLFHDRYYRSLMGRLVQHRFVPEWSKSSPAPSVSEKGRTEFAPEPFIALEPVEGAIAYALGAKQSSSGDKAQTRLWVEQDSFLIKKGRLASGSEFINSNFQIFPGGLQLPSNQVINWNDRVARVKLLSVEAVRLDKSLWSLGEKDAGTIPTDPLIKEFYSRFR